MGTVVKIDSNISGLRYTEEVQNAIGTRPAAASQTWFELEPNTYGDFGAKIKTVVRNPIKADRQRLKPLVVDLDAPASFNNDITLRNMKTLLSGFFVADYAEKSNFGNNAGTITGLITAVATSDDSYSGTSINTIFLANDLIFAENFTNSGNNGLKLVASVSAGKVISSTDLTLEASPPAAAKITRVGVQSGTADFKVNAAGALPIITSTTKDFTTMGLNPGEWIYVGGDSAATKFADAGNNGFMRVRSISANALTIDKSSGTMVTDASATGKTIQIFFGSWLRNRTTPANMRRRTFTLERTLGYSDTADITKEQADYVEGCVPNKLTGNIKSADKFALDLEMPGITSYVMDENTSGANTLLSKVSGVTRVAALAEDGLNTSSDFSRIRISTANSTSAFLAPLSTYGESFQFSIDNGASPNKAAAVFGAFDQSAADFAVDLSMSLYLANVTSVQALRNATDMTLDWHVVKSNRGISMDFPLLTLMDGLPKVEKDKPIMLPCSAAASSGARLHANLDFTASATFWPYLPNAADL